jgi:hypothetical protein
MKRLENTKKRDIVPTVTGETFSIIQSLCRVGLGAESPAFRRQVERLRDAFLDEKSNTEAASITKLLNAASRSTEIQPSKVSIFPAFVGIEPLTKSVAPPVDRETGSALAEIIFPEQSLLTFPILNDSLQSATESIIEEWKHLEVLKAANVLPPMTCLLYGPPGTGKTRVALSMAAHLGLPIVLARLDGVISSFLGTTGRNIANLFSFANRYQCILLLDEFDAIAKVRDDPHEMGEIKRVVNAILQNLDLRKDKGFTVATTNHEQLLDSAVWRRFDVRITIPVPTYSERLKIVDRYFGNFLSDSASAKFIAWLSEGMTGADLEVMAKHIKRFLTLKPEQSFLASLKHYSLTQAGRESLRHQSVLSLEPSDIARNIHKSPDLPLTQREIGLVLETSPSQIGRWLKENI